MLLVKWQQKPKQSNPFGLIYFSRGYDTFVTISRSRNCNGQTARQIGDTVSKLVDVTVTAAGQEYKLSRSFSVSLAKAENLVQRGRSVPLSNVRSSRFFDIEICYNMLQLEHGKIRGLITSSFVGWYSQYAIIIK